MVWGQGLGRGQGLGGVKVVVMVGGQNCGMIGGHKVGVSVGGQSRGVNVWGRVKVRGMRVKVWGVGVRWSVGFIV